MTVICVDDEKLILDLTVSLCREMEEIDRVEGFSDAAGAISFLEKEKADIALLDIDLPDMNGLALAAKIKQLSPDTAIIFLTGYAQYAVDAFAMHVSGYLLKPISREHLAAEIRYALENRRPERASRVKVRTFGNFEVIADGQAVIFGRAKAKELLAYLIDRQGSCVTRADAFTILWENGTYDRSMQKQLDVIVRSLRDTLRQYGIGEIFQMKSGTMRVCPERFDCDLYRFLEGDADAVNSYRGEYMNTYSWASMTEAYVTQGLSSRP